MSRLIIPTNLSAHLPNDGQSQIYHQIILHFNVLLVMLKIDKDIKQAIEEATGQTIPDPQGSQFETFFEQLARDHPEQAQKLEQALKVTEPYPDEQAQKQAQRRENISNLVERLFYTSAWGKKALNRRTVSLIIFFVIFSVMAASWSMTFFRKPIKAEVPQQVTPSTSAIQNSGEVSSPPTNMPDGTNLLIVPEVEVKSSPTPVNEAQANLPSNVSDAPPTSLTNSVNARPLEVPLAPEPLAQENSEIESIPTASVLATNEDATPLEFKSSVKLFEPAELATQPILVNAPETEVVEQNPVLAFSNDETSTPQEPVVAQSQGTLGGDALQTPPSADTSNTSSTRELATSPALAFNSEETSTQLAQNAESTSQVDSENSKADAPPELLESTTSLQETKGAQNNAGDLLETDIFNPTAATDLLKPGMLIPAILQKDIILTEGETRQVIADAEENWCSEAKCPSLRWIGTATLSVSGRLDVKLEQAVLEGEVLEVTGIAYGQDNAEGLPAHLADTTPTLLTDLFRAGAGGVTDYVEAEANRQKVTNNGDTTVTETSVPGLLEFILGRAASTMQIPSDETNIIRLAAVEKGTKLEVLYQEP